MQGSIFHEDWWLDAVAPGRWRQVECVRGGQIVGHLRFVERTFLGLKTCEMPPLTRVLGPVLIPQARKTEARMRATHSLLCDLTEQIAGHDHVHMTLNSGFDNIIPFLVSGYNVNVQPTFFLECDRPVEQLWDGLRDKTKNLIRRAGECLTTIEVDDPDRFAGFYETNLCGSDSYFDLSLISAIYAKASKRSQCRILAAVDHNHTPHAMAFLVWDSRAVYFFLATRDRHVSHLGALSLLLWKGIEFAQSRGLIFDFDGGISTVSRYRFMVAFGGTLANRFEIKRSTVRYKVQDLLMRRVPRAIGHRTANLLRPIGRSAPSADRSSGASEMNWNDVVTH